ncbi:Cell wall-associated polypeptide CWBP200 [Serratia ficaria]|uniref:Cell wall-associated polypeptide CWBP200 n=1 Tax=Serratia ficaria TaxID=61651 RepID=A0A240BMF7_SERFI|nr:RHS repeat-associated protein [Serratia ficaria]CAI0845535.1 Cell wall-associated polypeptide CWBP200 [Serratia ficaria]CAI0936612.1 Cell wall-associated polypeptide CWBP200 [Serratia ficaria]CAI0986908.1 Cell wall-associated polypeptide CWBP200 [Serratia ficaria]CAI2035654.1 Cell wall-associated polypeptide CWBP200 [Serratia ficaria]
MFYRYDAWGNLISRRNGIYEQHYRYDADNRLIQARGRGPQGEFDAQYHYDALGRRTRKTVSYKGKAAQTTRFVWQGYRLLQEQRADGSRRSWSYDPASPWSPLAALEQAGDSRSAEMYWYHTDLNSAPLEVSDAAGNLRWSGNYDTFGKLQGQTVEGAARRNGAQYDQPLRYAGQYQDDESGLHYNLFRYYEPEVGRFTTQDPIGLAGGFNLYAYGLNPLMWVDPLGLTSCSIQPGKNFKDHFIRHKGILENYLGKKYPKWKVDEGAEFLKDIEHLRDSGKLVHIGQGTIKKGQPVMEVYRGEGMTYISKKLSDGKEEFVTLIESGKGMDLGIVFSP